MVIRPKNTHPEQVHVRSRTALARLALALVLPLTAASCADIAGNRVEHLQRKEHKMILIDTRTPEEYAAGHLPGAILIPHDRIPAEIESCAPDHSARILLYCRSGRRAETAKAAMEAAGYTAVENLGGIAEAAEKLQLDIVQ